MYRLSQDHRLAYVASICLEKGFGRDRSDQNGVFWKILDTNFLKTYPKCLATLEAIFQKWLFKEKLETFVYFLATFWNFLIPTSGHTGRASNSLNQRV